MVTRYMAEKLIDTVYKSEFFSFFSSKIVSMRSKNIRIKHIYENINIYLVDIRILHIVPHDFDIIK